MKQGQTPGLATTAVMESHEATELRTIEAMSGWQGWPVYRVDQSPAQSRQAQEKPVEAKHYTIKFTFAQLLSLHAAAFSQMPRTPNAEAALALQGALDCLTDAMK